VQAGGGCQHGSYECWSGRTPKALTERHSSAEARAPKYLHLFEEKHQSAV